VLAWAVAYATPAHADAPTPEQLEQACGRGEAAGCLALGLLFEQGDARAFKDEVRAAKLYGQACTAGEPRGCNLLGILYEEGRGAPKDPRQAAGFYEKACTANYSNACFNLGLLHLHGSGVEKNEARAAGLFDSTCQANRAEACYQLGALYIRGTGVEPDASKAGLLFTKACKLGDGRACTLVQSQPEAQAAAAPKPSSDDGAHFALVLTLGAQFGGEELVSASWSDGGTSTLNAGDALSISVGAILEPWGGDFHVLQLQSTVGYNYTSLDASNASAKLTQVPVELLAFYRYRPAPFRIGGGLQFQIGASFESEGLGLVSPVSFGDAVGFVVQVDWVPYEFLTVYGRYTALSYSPPLLQQSVAGGGFGIGMTIAPRIL
jgi:hypothetical protein